MRLTSLRGTHMENEEYVELDSAALMVDRVLGNIEDSLGITQELDIDPE